MLKNIDPSWNRLFDSECEKPYFRALEKFLANERDHYTVYPSDQNIFNAFYTTAFEKIKVVILGQDPYHGAHQAHGLAFSVEKGTVTPPSLQNIFKELQVDLDCEIPENGDLTQWAKQGVFLLNTVLSVRANIAHSHKNRGWEEFTDTVIRYISVHREHAVFILWGKPAQVKSRLIDSNKHLILAAPHPSPLSAYRGFFGSKPFSQTNKYLRSIGQKPVDWCLD